MQKIGHAGTLDPFATGVMVMLIGRNFTKLSDSFLCNDKEYVAQVHLGISTDTYDCDGNIIHTSDLAPKRLRNNRCRQTIPRKKRTNTSYAFCEESQWEKAL